MTNPNLELYICIINLITGMFVFIIYYGILLIQKNKNKYICYILDIISVSIISIIYIFILNNNKIDFHIYHLIFLSTGYLISVKYFKNQLNISYNIIFKITNYINDKMKIIIKWSLDIVPYTLLKNKINKIILKHKIKKTIIKFNKKIILNKDTI